MPATLPPTAFQRQTAAGPVAQWLEPAAHNGLVAGSSPAGPTNKINVLPILIFSRDQKLPQIVDESRGIRHEPRQGAVEDCIS
jgi:hypothetical protein